MKKTPLQKEQDKKRDNLQRLCNRIKTAYEFKQISTWGEVYKFTSQPVNPSASHLSSQITIHDLRQYFSSLKEQLETGLAAVVEQRLGIGKEEAGPQLTNEQYEKETDRAIDITNSILDSRVHETDSTSENDVDVCGTSIIGQNSRTKDILSVNGNKDVQIEHQNVEPAIIPKINHEELFHSRNNYGFKPSPFEKGFHYWFQKKAISEALYMIQEQKRNALMVLAGTGDGKTFICASIIRHLIDSKFHENKSFGLVNYLYVTKSTVVEQAKRVFHNLYQLGIKDAVEVLNIEQLRSRAGKLWVVEESKIIDGNEVVTWKWKRGVNPVIIIWDECQGLKNSGSTQHKIAAALNDLTDVVQIFVSATPFAKVSEAKCFCVATHKDITDIIGIPTTLSNETWGTFAHSITEDPEDYNEAACKRLRAAFDGWIVQVKGVKRQFDAVNKIMRIKFQTTEERAYYLTAWQKYLEEKTKADAIKAATGEAASEVNMLVEFLKFRMAAEFCRANYLADQLYKSATQDHKAAVCALNFKGTIIQIVKRLTEYYHIPRNKISLVWGGGQTELTDKQKAKNKILAQTDKLKEAGIDVQDMLVSLELDKIEAKVLEALPKHLQLGVQSKDARQVEIDSFQSGKSDYCLFTFRAGGVGLSLHHTDELTTKWDETATTVDETGTEINFATWYERIKLLPESQRPKPGKVRHKEDSGYAVEMDIPFIPVRPRRLFAAPTYSAIEMVQGLGRCPRLNSLSVTEQYLVFYAGTIEDDVADIVSLKLACLSQVVRQREKWADIIVGGVAKSDHMKELKPASQGEDELNDGIPEGDV